MKNIVLAICCVLLSSSAFADCESDARAAFARITTSGPYHFERTKWNRGKSYLLIGKSIPNYRTYYRYIGEAHEEFFEKKITNK